MTIELNDMNRQEKKKKKKKRWQLKVLDMQEKERLVNERLPHKYKNLLSELH